MRRESAHNETPLPSGYKQLEYIGYDNRYYNQFIQTNITQVKWRYSYYFEVIIPQKVNIDDEGDYYYNYDYMIVHGCRGGGFGQRNKFGISQKRFSYPSTAWGSTVFQPPIDFTIKHKIYENYDNVTIDGIYYTISRSQSAIYTNNSNLLLFKSDDVPNGQNGAGKLCRFRVSDSGTVLCDGYPALRLQDSKPGLYDLVGNIFYTNQGTGEFLYA